MGHQPLVQFPYAFPSSLAGTSRLVVPTRPYVVRAAPGLTPTPGLGLPSASTGDCDRRRGATHPHGPSAPRGEHEVSSIHRARTHPTESGDPRFLVEQDDPDGSRRDLLSAAPSQEDRFGQRSPLVGDAIEHAD